MDHEHLLYKKRNKFQQVVPSPQTSSFWFLFCIVIAYGTSCCFITLFVAKLIYSTCEVPNISSKLKECQPPSIRHEEKAYTYKLVANSDVRGKDLFHVHAKDLAMSQKACDRFKECLGYNSNGWLKTSADASSSPQADFYIKQQVQNPEKVVIDPPVSVQLDTSI